MVKPAGSEKGWQIMRVWQESNRLVIGDGRYTLWIEPWGVNSFRVRMTGEAVMDDNDWALNEKVCECVPQISCGRTSASSV